jgi:hypothetical protein
MSPKNGKLLANGLAKLTKSWRQLSADVIPDFSPSKLPVHLAITA